MKLNNKGWSLNTLLICMAVILSFLFVSVFYVYKISTRLSNDLNNTNNSNNYVKDNSSNISDGINSGNSQNNNLNQSTDSNSDSANDDDNDSQVSDTTDTSKNKYYATKESQLRAGTIRYLKENAITVSDDETITINASDIINKKYIQSIKDERTNNVCDGYSIVSFKDNDYVVKSYIDCDSYSSNGYGVDNQE